MIGNNRTPLALLGRCYPRMVHGPHHSEEQHEVTDGMQLVHWGIHGVERSTICAY